MRGDVLGNLCGLLHETFRGIRRIIHILDLYYTLQTRQVYTTHLNIMRYHIDTSKGPYAPVRFSPYNKTPSLSYQSTVQYDTGTVRYDTGTVLYHTAPYGTLPSRTVPSYRTLPTMASIVRYSTVPYCTVSVPIRTENYAHRGHHNS